MKKLFVLLVIAAVMTGMLFAQGANEAAVEKEPTELVVWAACQDKEAQALIEAFNVQHPEIKVSVIRAGASELNTRLVAEQPKPSGDILLGASQEILDGNYDLFDAYKSVNDDKIPSNLRDQAETPKYYSYSMPIQCFVVNTDLLTEDEYPRTWLDLTDPKYAGKIILGNPALSGGAYAQLYMIWKLYGEEVFPALAKNATFVPSSTTVSESVVRGEYAIGANPEYNISKYMEKGAHVIAVYPEDGTGLRFDGSAIIKNGPNHRAAELFMDFLTTEEAYQIIRDTQGRRVAYPGIPGPSFMPELSEIKLFDYDALEASEMRNELTEKLTDLMIQ